MLVSNDIGIHDYFYAKLNLDSLKNLYSASGFTKTDLIQPYIGIYASINPSFMKTDYEQLYQKTIGLTKDEISAQRLTIYTDYQQKPAFRQQLRNLTEEVGKGLKFDEERNFSFSLPQTTASEMHQYLSTLIKAADNSIEAKVFDIILEANQNIYRERIFDQYAGVFDNRIGLQNGMDWGIAKEGGERIQVVFFDELPVGFWFHLSSDLIIQDIQQRMIWDKELRTLLPNNN
jgi:hypothetical protein